MKSNNMLFLRMILSLQLTGLNVGLIAVIFGGQFLFVLPLPVFYILRLSFINFLCIDPNWSRHKGANEIVIVLCIR